MWHTGTAERSSLTGYTYVGENMAAGASSSFTL